jgi:limonene-1,2-epoxide hydrolase
MSIQCRLSAVVAVIVLLASPAGAADQSKEQETPSMSNQQIVTEFIEAWSRLDPDELVSYFANDGTYHNMMLPPVTGHENLRAMIGGFLADWTKTDWDILNIVSDGDVVIAERLDRTQMGGRSVALPCTGVFVMEDGKIKVWRDYFDLATYSNAAGS